MNEHLTSIDRLGRVVVPAQYRRALGLEPGQPLVLTIHDGGLLLSTLEQRVASAQAIVRQFVPAEVSLVDELIADRRATKDE